MNTPARRDGTPDRRNRSDQPPARGGSPRSTGSRGARAAQRGAAAERGGWGEDRGARRGGSAERGGWSEDRRGGQGGASQRGTGSRASSRGEYTTPSGSPQRGSSWSGQGERGARGAAPASRSGGPGRGGTGQGERGARGAAPAARSGAPSRGATGQGGARKPATAPKKTPKVQRPSASAPLLSNAKPARHQHVESETEVYTGDAHVKLPAGEGERLQKVLAKAGVASRRAAEEMIEQGRIEVDGAIVQEQGLRIDPQKAVIRVDGIRVMVREELVHIALNKPKGWQSTMSDDLGRPCVGDIVAERIAAGQRLFHVGRLDADTEGLLLLTNDGDLAHRLMHPSFEVSKTYLATVNGEVHKGIGKRLRDGLELDDGPAKVDKFQVLELGEGRSLVKLELHEGRKHIVRRLLAAVGHPVIRLVRTNIGPVALGDQRPGTLKVLGRGEVGKLYEAVSL
ncbi:pseudouridine synthase [Nocardia sp. NPDC050435]|uniref:pseudouridine synthase n=1 Tax=Nocardia sp. NPDC050435 TaxID=3155040 RepID=UPI0033DA8AE8